MANRFFSPNQQFADNTGLPYAGGSLAFYASGTSTPLTTYSDSALTIANTNPVVLDSAGRSGNIFLQNLAYKVVLSDVNSNIIWTDDPVYSSDYSTRAKLTTGSGSPNGNTAGTAGSAGIGADTYWDSTNLILYVCTTTGNAASAVWTAVNASTATAIVPQPQGYLTPLTGTPVITSDVTNGNVFYTPYLGNLVPVYNGTSFVSTVFTELNLTLSASQTASTIYDVFVFNSSGVLTLVTGPAWSSSAAASSSRGTGAGTTQISRLNGIWVNTVQMSGKNGVTTYTVPASQGTYLGSILIDSTPGQVTCFRSYGQNRTWSVWNAYNRVPTFLKAGDPTATWTVGATAFRNANNSAANKLTVFSGLAEEVFDLSYENTCGSNGPIIGTSGVFAAAVAVGLNGTAVGKNSTGSFSNQSAATPFGITHALKASYLLNPGFGINVINALEANTGTVTNVYNGLETGMMLSGRWRA